MAGKGTKGAFLMSELRTRIAAGVTILAIGGLGAVALTHPQAPPPTAQVQPAGAQVAHQSSARTAHISADDHFEGADD
jgi:hypothetical protein